MNNITNKQLIAALKEKTLEAINAFDPSKAEIKELVALAQIIFGLISYAGKEVEPLENPIEY